MSKSTHGHSPHTHSSLSFSLQTYPQWSVLDGRPLSIGARAAAGVSFCTRKGVVTDFFFWYSWPPSNKKYEILSSIQLRIDSTQTELVILNYLTATARAMLCLIYCSAMVAELSASCAVTSVCPSGLSTCPVVATYHVLRPNLRWWVKKSQTHTPPPAPSGGQKQM